MPTFVKAVHVELPHKGGYICMFEILPVSDQLRKTTTCFCSYARTLAKSAVGYMMKLSLLFDHEIRFCMLVSSSMLNCR